MKKYLFLCVLAIVSIVGRVFGQTPATLPYSCNFNEPGNNGWTLKNGSCVNKWYVGSFSSPEGYSSALYISNDNGETAHYTTTPGPGTVSVAEKNFSTGGTAYLTISFDLTVGGDFINADTDGGLDGQDYLKVFWVDNDTNYVPGNALDSERYYSTADYTNGLIMSNNMLDSARFKYLSKIYDVQRMSVTIPNEPYSIKKLVFVWRSSSMSYGDSNSPIIDNIDIHGTNCNLINLKVPDITDNSAEVNWNGSAGGVYEIRLNGGTSEIVTTTSKVLTGLNQNTDYEVEVRSLYPGQDSTEWKSISFKTAAVMPYTCDFEAEGDNDWILKKDLCRNQWYIGTFDIPEGYSSSLYISGNGGTRADFANSRTVVVAEKLFRTGTSDSLYISFDYTQNYTSTPGGVLSVYWVPADTVYEATKKDTIYYAQGEYTVNRLSLNGRGKQFFRIANEPNSLKKLVFVWKNRFNAGGYGSSIIRTGAIVDNVKVMGYCTSVTDLGVHNLTETSSEVSWNGSADNYEIRLNGGASDTVSTTSKVFTGLTSGAKYLVEVRSLCADGFSEWDSIIFRPMQTPVGLPYTCDFEADGDNGWLIKNDTCINRWYVGRFDSVAGHSGSLYISGDGGTTAGYDTEAGSVVVSEKLFRTGTSDSLIISFDLTVEGYSIYDYLKVFWVPADTNYEASTNTSAYYAVGNYGTNVIMNNSNSDWYRLVSSLEGTQTMSVTVDNEPNSLKKLVFVWRNSGYTGSQPGAIIDNISITELCNVPTALTVSNITENTAEVSWNGSASGYEVRLNGGAAETVTTTSKTFSGLTEITNYTVEVRAVCSDGVSVWNNISFMTRQTPVGLPYVCDFEAAGDNGWLLKNGICANKWYVGSFDSVAGHSGSLYISGDGGTTAGYNNVSSVIVAEKLFNTGTSDSLTISFDLTIGGEVNWDYLKVFWAPADTNYEASTSDPYYAGGTYANNVILNSSDGSLSREFVCLLTGTQRMTATLLNEPNSLRKLVFLWKNDSSAGDQPGAIIDNISITGSGDSPVEPCDAPTALTVSNITETTAEVSWNGSASGYEVRLNGGVAETVTTTSKTLSGLTAGTAYTVEVRAVCESSNSAWVSTNFTTQQSSSLAEATSGAITAVIYPNPAKDKATLQMSGITADATLIISDMQGRILATETIAAGSKRYELNTSNYASGVYYIRIVAGNTVNTQKLIVE